jgi:hypothetical protein
MFVVIYNVKKPACAPRRIQHETVPKGTVSRDQHLTKKHSWAGLNRYLVLAALCLIKIQNSPFFIC